MIGLCHFSIGDHDSALEYFSESVHRRIFSHGINHPIVHQAKIDVAHVLTSKERVDDALELFLKYDLSAILLVIILCQIVLYPILILLKSTDLKVKYI